MLKGNLAENEINDHASYIAGKLFKAARKRLLHSDLTQEVMKFIQDCEGEPSECLLEEGAKEVLAAKAEEVEEKPVARRHKKHGTAGSFHTIPKVTLDKEDAEDTFAVDSHGKKTLDAEASALTPEEEETIKKHPGMRQQIEDEASSIEDDAGIADSIERKVRARAVERKKAKAETERLEHRKRDLEQQLVEVEEQMVQEPRKRATNKQRKHALAHETAEPIPRAHKIEKSQKLQHKSVKHHSGRKHKVSMLEVETTTLVLR